MPEKMFITVWGLQKAEIETHCFGSCKKVIFGLLMDEQLGGLSHCFEANCPFVEKEMSEPFGEVNGTNAYLRKLTAAQQPLEADRALPASQQADNSNGPAA
jgi:hypothetical protein